jgi:hypothetical protein
LFRLRSGLCFGCERSFRHSTRHLLPPDGEKRCRASNQQQKNHNQSDRYDGCTSARFVFHALLPLVTKKALQLSAN